MLTADQKGIINHLTEVFEFVNNLPSVDDPLIQIVERALHEKNQDKLRNQAEHETARAESAIHIDYLAQRCMGLFSQYGVTLEWTSDLLKLSMPGKYGIDEYRVDAKYVGGHYPFSGLQYKEGIHSRTSNAHTPQYEVILECIAKWVAYNIRPTV